MKKNNKKLLLCLCVCMSISLCVPLPIYAADKLETIVEENNIENIVRSEKVQWYYRYNAGMKQKRLWSVTYGYWKTNWINC